MKRLLITGAGGFLGSQLVDIAKLKYDVYGISLNSNINLTEDKSYYINVGDQELLERTLAIIQPDFIIHCAAISSEGGCRKDPSNSYKTNVSSTITIAKYCTKKNVRLIFTSSDLVFDGENEPYEEDANVIPAMVYGQQKRQAEIELQSFSNTVSVRVPLLYGLSTGERSGLLTQFVKSSKEGKNQNLFTDEYRTPAFSKDIASFLIQLLDIEYHGILHLGGKERISRYELGKLFCKHLKLDESLLVPFKQVDINMIYRPSDASMNSELAYSLGFQPNKIDVALQQIFELL